MTPTERFARFEKIKDVFLANDKERLRKGQFAIRETEYGLWGTTNMNDAYELFKRIRLDRFKKFVDLGCGDGRIVAIASLYTDAKGFEGDDELVKEGKDAFAKLDLDQSMIETKNYYDEDFSTYDIIFMFPDNRYDEEMLAKLTSEFTGYLFIYNDIHRPEGLQRGKTYWIEQLPIVSYPINVEDKDLETD